MLQDLERYSEYLTEYKRLSDHTRQSYLRDVRQFVEFMSERRVLIPEEITAEDFEAYQTWLSTCGFQNSTIFRKIVSIRAFYHFLYREHNIRMENIDTLVIPKLKRKEPQILSAQNMDKLVEMPSGNSPKEIRDRAILELLYATGIKVSELISLKREQLDLQMDCVTCGSGIMRRTIPFGEQARNAIVRYLQEGRLYFGPRDNERTIFLNFSGKPLSRQGIFKMVRWYGERAGIEESVTPDIIRHSFAAILIENGADLKSVQKMMGHVDIGTTEIYARRKKVSEREEYKRAHPRG